MCVSVCECVCVYMCEVCVCVFVSSLYCSHSLFLPPVLEFEPNNSTVLEFLPVIKLRLELGKLL